MRLVLLPFAIVCLIGSDHRRADLPAIHVSTQLIGIHDAPDDPSPGATVRFTWKTERAKRVLIENGKEISQQPAEGSIDVPGGGTLSFTALGPGGVTVHVVGAYPASRPGAGRNGRIWNVASDVDLRALFPSPYEVTVSSDSSLDVARRRAIDAAQRVNALLTTITTRNSTDDFAAIREDGVEPAALCEGNECTLAIDKRVRERALTFRIWIHRIPAGPRSGTKAQLVIRVQSSSKSRLRKVGGEWVNDKTDADAAVNFAKFLVVEIQKGL